MFRELSSYCSRIPPKGCATNHRIEGYGLKQFLEENCSLIFTLRKRREGGFGKQEQRESRFIKYIKKHG